MVQEEQIRHALSYYQTLAERAHAYWDGWTGDASEGTRRYALYLEYAAKRDTLAWVLDEVESPDTVAPAHTVFPPDLTR